MTVVELRRRKRVLNVTGSETCGKCADGWIEITETRHGIPHEALAPCPYCERGYHVEYGIRRNSDGTETATGGPWGSDGFWRGRELPDEA